MGILINSLLLVAGTTGLIVGTSFLIRENNIKNVRLVMFLMGVFLFLYASGHGIMGMCEVMRMAKIYHIIYIVTQWRLYGDKSLIWKLY